MRVEFWPSAKTEQAEAFFAMDLDIETTDFLLNVALNNSRGAVTQINSTSTGPNCLRWRVRSPAMLLTMSQCHRKAIPELEQVTALLKKGADLDWEIRIPTSAWGIDQPITLIDVEKEEVPV